jgi:AhpD family alkylhydroperoxidase
MTLLRNTEWAEPLLEPRRNQTLERWAKRRTGIIPAGIEYLAACPEIVHMYYELEFAPRVHIDPDLFGLIALVVSQDNSCRYCYAGTRVLLTLMGVPENRIRELELALQGSQDDLRIQPALDFARRLSRANPLPSAADKKALREAGFSAGAVKELAFMAGTVVVANRIATLPALPPQPAERLADSRLLRLLRPLLAWRVRPLLRPTVEPERISDDRKRGPYSDLVLALDGLPAAGVLRNALDAVWASPHSTPRAKALVFAVIARGLGCLRSEREAFRLLAQEGLGKDETEKILADLAGPELDAIEAAFVPYARQTLWCEPVSIQRRGRALLEHLSTEQFLELVGLASLANMVCRLEVILDDS